MKVSGFVYDEFNVPMPGVSVYLKGNTTDGTSTNDAGYYDHTFKQRGAVVFSHVAKEKHEITPLFERNNIVLFPKDIELGEVVVTGQQQPKKSTNWLGWILAAAVGTYAYNKFKAKKGAGLNAPRKAYKKRSSTKKIAI